MGFKTSKIFLLLFLIGGLEKGRGQIVEFLKVFFNLAEAVAAELFFF